MSLLPLSPRTPFAVVPAGTPPGSPFTPRPPAPSSPPSRPPRRPTSKTWKALRALRSLLRALPLLPPSCSLHDGHVHSPRRATGTLFGHRKARITLAIQETPQSPPLLFLELAMQTGKFMQELGAEQVRVALECEKKRCNGSNGDDDDQKKKTSILDEPLWTAYVNGRKVGYALKREPSRDDVVVMEVLQSVSVGAGVLPCAITEKGEGDLAYMRALFDRVVGGKDSESFYMLNPEGTTSGPDLSIFFVRI
ncbi:protein MIZU-KUSSEI 1-like [Typha latifolia]|uniref:protein MIZU-KUSSEI 1-like n=1 Tax=Typha latifolia TaxID=4733 RepID=UPI003C2C2F3E